MSRQKDKDSPATREPRSGPVSSLAGKRVPGCDPSPSPSTFLFPAARTSLSPARPGWRSPSCAAPEEHLEPPLPLPSPGPWTTHPRTPARAQPPLPQPPGRPSPPRPPQSLAEPQPRGRGRRVPVPRWLWCPDAAGTASAPASLVWFQLRSGGSG